MGIYKLTAGRFRRFENGVLTAYTTGDLVDLDADEVRRLSRIIKPVGRAPRPDSLSGPETADPSDPAQPSAPAYSDGEEPQPRPTGHPVFTAADTPNRTFTELKKVVANIGEPSVLTDMIEVEEAMSKRSTVLRMLETRRLKLELDAEAEEEAEDGED